MPAAINQSLVMCGIVFFYFGLKKSDFVRNEFGSVRFEKMRFCSDIIFIANLRAIFNDILRKISTIFYAKTRDSLYCGRSAALTVSQSVMCAHS